MLGLAPLRQGRIVFDSVDIGTLSSTMRAHLRRRVVFITGDDDVLDPRMNVRETVEEPLSTHMNLGAAQNERPRRRRCGASVWAKCRSCAGRAN